MKKINHQDAWVFAIWITMAMAAWGGSWTSAKMIATMTSPQVLVFWRFLLTFISFIPLLLIRRENLRINLRTLVLTFFSAVLMMVYNALFFAGLQTGMAGAGGVLVTSLNPLFTFMITAILFRSRIRFREIIGLVLGLCGGLIILEIWQTTLQSLIAGGNLLFLLAALVWAAMTVVSHKAQENEMSTFTYSFYVYGISSLFDLLMALPHGLLEVVRLPMVFWGNLVYLSLIATTFATTVYFLGSKRLGANQTSSFMFLVPVFAVLFSWLILKETPRIATIAGGILATVAVYFVNTKKQLNSPALNVQSCKNDDMSASRKPV